MPELDFKITGVEAVPYAAVPTLGFKLNVAQAAVGELLSPIHTVVLRCQIRIEPTQRRYSPEEKQQMADLFGEPSRWGQTLRSMLWTHSSVVVPGFTDSTTIDMPVPCTYDFNVAATKYFAGLSDGDIPLCFLFSGTIFHADESGALQIAQISWEKEANFRLPASVWQQMMQLYYPNSAWLNLRQDVFDELREFKTRMAFHSWEQTMQALLAGEQEGVRP